MRKKHLFPILMFLCCNMLFAQENIALNRPVITSTVGGSTYPKSLNDGNLNTVWTSLNNRNAQWMQIDLENVYDLTKIVVSWANASAAEYTVYASSNATDWTVLAQVSNTEQSVDKSLDLSNVNAVRYLRIEMTKPISTSGYSIREVQINGSLSTVTALPAVRIVMNSPYLVTGYEKASVLSLNNSLIDNNDQPSVFNPLALSAGKKVLWEKQTRLGQTLRYHYEEGEGSATVQTARYRIRSKAWTHIILQEQSNKPITDYDDFLASVKLWVNYVRENCPNPNARIILDMNWPYTDAVDFKGDMARLWNNYLMVAAETGVSVYPVGKAYDLILDKDGLASKNMLYTDNRHPSWLATYLSACTILAGMYETSPEGIAYRPSALTAAQAQLMQTRAWETSQTYQNTCDLAGTIHFSAELKDQFNRAVSSDASCAWTVSGGGTIDNNGTFTSDKTPGVYTVSVTKGEWTSSTSIEVKSAAELFVDPVITTQAVTGILATSAVANGTITTLGMPVPDQYGHCWSTATGPTLADNKSVKGVASMGPFVTTMTGLTPNTTYYVRSYATTTNGTFFGPEEHFTTSAKDLVAEVSAGGSYRQDFDVLGTVAHATLPEGWRIEKMIGATAQRVVGTYLLAAEATEYAGGSNMIASAKNGLYNFGAGDSLVALDRAVGGSTTGSTASTQGVNFYLHLRNTGSTDISSLNVAYDVEKYRFGSNAAGFTFQMYTSLDGNAWTSAGSDFKTNFVADAVTAGAEIVPIEARGVSAVLPVHLSVNQDLYLAWNYSVTSGTSSANAQELALDNVVIDGGSASGLTSETPEAVRVDVLNGQLIVTGVLNPVVSIFDVRGVNVFSEKNANVFDVSDLYTGLYFVFLETPDGKQVKKIRIN